MSERERDELAESLRWQFKPIIREADEWRPLAQHILDLLAEERAFRQRVVEAFAKELEARTVIGSYNCQIVNVGICEALRRAGLWPEVEARLANLKDVP